MSDLRRTWERQRHLIDYSAASMARRKGRNLGLLAVYGGMVFLLASVLFYSSALKHEANLLLAEAPEIVVQRMVAGRHAPVSGEHLLALQGIRGLRDVEGRLWG